MGKGFWAGRQLWKRDRGGGRPGGRVCVLVRGVFSLGDESNTSCVCVASRWILNLTAVYESEARFQRRCHSASVTAESATLCCSMGSGELGAPRGSLTEPEMISLSGKSPLDYRNHLLYIKNR